MSLEAGVARLGRELQMYSRTLGWYVMKNNIPQSLFSRPDHVAATMGGTDKFLELTAGVKSMFPQAEIHTSTTPKGNFINLIRMTPPLEMLGGRIKWMELTEDDGPELITRVDRLQYLVPDLTEAKDKLFAKEVRFEDEGHAVIAPIAEDGREVWFSEESITARLGD